MNSGVRIVLDRQADGLWNWTLTVGGEQHRSKRGELSAELAAQAAEIHRNHLSLFKDRHKASA